MSTYSRMLVASLAMLAPLCLHAQEEVTLAQFHRGDAWMNYRGSDLVAQAARFDIGMPMSVRAIAVTLAGPARGTARVRLIGEEAGAAAPLFGLELAPAIVLRKQKSGIERVMVELPARVALDERQCFVVVDELSAGMRLLSDRTPVAPRCTDGDERFVRQLIRRRGGSWEAGACTFAIELLGTPAPARTRPGFVDITATAFPDDTTAVNAGIACADINGDGLLDILAGGRLYRNNGDRTFRVLTGIVPDGTRMQFFIDADGDHDADILAFTPDSLYLLLNAGGNAFERRITVNAAHELPTCFAVGDIDGDGQADVFLGRSASGADTGMIGSFLMNDGAGGFRLDTSRVLRSVGEAAMTAQWVDLGNSSRPTLAVTTSGGRNLMYDPVGTDGSFVQRAMNMPAATAIGSDWNYADGDLRPDLLLPSATRLAVPNASAFGSVLQLKTMAVDGTHGEPGAEVVRVVQTPPMVERAGCAWADVDNDGLGDFIATSACPCGYVDVYRQSPSHEFTRATDALGLRGVVGGPDAVWADIDNDGRVDLVMMQAGRLHLLHNEIPVDANHFVEFDLVNPSGGTALGARVTAFSGDVHATRVAGGGRGLAMQPPARLHFGLGTAGVVDSVVVRWPGSDAAITYRDVAVDRVQTLGATTTAGEHNELALEAFPNPFTDRLVIRYVVDHRCRVRLDLYAADGRLVRSLVDEERDAGSYTATVSARDDAASMLAAGVYLCRLSTPSGERSVKATLQR